MSAESRGDPDREGMGRSLPRGRHGLSREHVERSQRQRLERAVVEAVADGGLSATTVQELVGRAAVSRQTFYELYASKDDCFDQAMWGLADDLVGAVGASTGGASDPRGRLGHYLTTLLAGIAKHPLQARCLFLEARCTSSGGEARVAFVQGQFSTAFRHALGDQQRQGADDLAALLRQLITDQVVTGELEAQAICSRLLLLADAIGSQPFARVVDA